MYGFGSPDDFPVAFTADAFDYGFGDVPPDDPIVVIDWGFGDVPPEPLEPVVVTLDELPDDGGEIIVISADWPIVGPYHVQLIQHFTEQTFPDVGDAPGAYAPVLLTELNKVMPRGSPYWCYTGIKPVLPGDVPGVYMSDGSLAFVLPVVPPGLYDIKVSWGTQKYPPPEDSADSAVVAHVFHSSITISQALRIIYRNRSMEQWRIRRRFPMHFATGAKAAGAEELLEGPGD